MNYSGNNSIPDDGTDSIKMFITLGVLLLVMLVGLVTNALSAVVWMTQSKGNSAALFIGCLSFTDALYCLVTFLFSIIMVAEERILSLCLLYMAKEMLLISANASRLLTVAVLAQRWLAVSKPLLMTRLCTLQRQLIVLVCLSLPIIAIFAFDIYVIWWGERTCEHTDFEEGMEHFMQAYRTLNLAFHVMCFMCMFVFSGALLYSSCNISQVTSGLRSRHRQRDLELRMTVTILCVSAISMVEFSLSIMFIFIILGFDLEGVDSDTASIVFMFVVLVTRPVNFVVYSCMGKEFRIKLKSMCKCKCSSAS